ncbi:ATP-binding cassette domain-containing protein [Miniphocaeibacter massiliensis]|uniref:ATP-binding cassette domain-containing protein n=1 Tax=Miniphocaeibacter massiliensis TaxID=2041841 RepID=UPI000C072A3D|nr:ATP-binding cassette domain-containing protein [Miniphocaeibacter massiliensis]
MDYILRTNKLSKSIKNKDIVKDVSLNIKRGEIYGFLGPNGAGKTSIMKMITGIWKPSFGSIEVFGKEITPKSYKYLKNMGIIIEQPVFYDHMSGYDNLKIHCEYMGFYKKGAIEETLNLLGLVGTGKKAVKSYSLGMKQRLGIARAILTKPDILILDEPTNGLDPSGMKEIRDLFNMLSKDYGITIMISTHILSEIEDIVDTVGIINRGNLINEISMIDIERDNASYIEIEVNDTKAATYILSDKLGLSNFKVIDNSVIRIYEVDIETKDISKVLAMNDIEISKIQKISESLEDYFLKVTQEVDR